MSKKKKFILNQNNYRNAHHRVLSTAKKNYTDYVRALGLKCDIGKTITNPIHCHYKYFPKTNRKYDSMNVISIHDKFLMDALIGCGVIVDDNYRHVLWPTFEPCAPDRDNPRMEVVLYEHTPFKIPGWIK